MINSRTMELEKTLIEAINSANVNIAAVYLILDKLTKEAKLTLNEVIKKETENLSSQNIEVENQDLIDMQ